MNSLLYLWNTITSLTNNVKHNIQKHYFHVYYSSKLEFRKICTAMFAFLSSILVRTLKRARYTLSNNVLWSTFHFVFIKLTFLGLWIHMLEMVESVARHLMFNLLNHVLYFHVSFSMHYFYTYLSIFGITKESLVMGISTRTLVSKAWNSICNLLFDLWNECSSYIATKR